MPVHVGQITSEVHAVSGANTDEASSPTSDDWEERARIAGLLRQLARDRRRTATGHGDD